MEGSSKPEGGSGKTAPSVTQDRFWTGSTIILLVVGIIGIACLILFSIRAKNYCKRTKGSVPTAETKPVEPKPETPKTPTPEESKPSTPVALLPLNREEKATNSGEGGEADHAQSDDPFVTESKLVKTCEAYYGKAKRFVCDKIRGVKEFIVKCQNEPTPGAVPGRAGRQQNQINCILFERAVVYQMTHRPCKRAKACRESFVSIAGGYPKANGISYFWKDHRVEAQSIADTFQKEMVKLKLTPEAYYAQYDRNTRVALKGIRT